MTWSEIRGQKRPLNILETALDTGRVHHGYLFTGLQGVGKFLTAHRFAAIVNCRERPEDEFRRACGDCSSCRKIDRRQHPDVLFVEPDGATIKIAQIRDVQKAATKAPYEARYRFVLIDDAHTLTEQAANALLKTLEEPSDRMRLILVTDQPNRLPDTIISRCQVLRFGALERADVVDLLGDCLTDSDQIDELPDTRQMTVAAGYGEGSVGRSIAIIESGMLEARREFLDQVMELADAESVALLDLADQISSDRHELNGRLDVLKLFFRDIVLHKSGVAADRLVNDDLADAIDGYARRVSLDHGLDLIDQIRQAQRLLDRHVNAQLIAEQLLANFQSPTAVPRP